MASEKPVPIDLKPDQMGRDGATSLLRAFMAAGDDDELLVRHAEREDGEPYFLCTMNDTTAALTSVECGLLANVAENTLNAFPGAAETRGFRGLISNLRELARSSRA